MKNKISDVVLTDFIRNLRLKDMDDEAVRDRYSIDYISPVKLSNGNVLIEYEDGNEDHYGMYIIISSTGEIIVDEKMFNNKSTLDISTDVLPNGSIVISFRDDSNNYYGTVIIMGHDGSEIYRHGFNSHYDQHPLPIALSNGNLLLAYTDADNGCYGTFVIISQTYGVVNKVVFNRSKTNRIVPFTLPDGDVIITYADGGNDQCGTYCTVSPTGDILDRVVFNAKGNVDSISLTALHGGSTLISYRDIDSEHRGIFIIRKHGDDADYGNIKN